MTVSTKNTAAQILEALTSDILEGAYLPGEKLHIKTLRGRYEVGTSPLREALSQLIAKDLVVSENQKGFYVTEISIDDLEDIYQARAKIEALCVQMAIEKGDDYWEANCLAAMHRLNKSSGAESVDLKEWQKRHSSFHSGLASGCKSPRLLQIRRSLFEKSTRYRNLWLKENVTNADTLEVNQQEHTALLNFALERDVKGATQLVEAHILTPVEIIKKALH
ncbi:MAG: DNA-binding transcriptional regulator CsiR [Gammaproteobacteria bacterium]|nr:DNA-binding transcriptional regulator CsiR [Gammaproteobacteria bacterium]